MTGLHRSYMVPDADASTAGQTRIFNNPFFTLYEELNDEQAIALVRQRQRRRTSPPTGSSSTTRSAPTTPTTSGSRGVRRSAPTSPPVAASRKASSSNYQIDHNLTATATWHLSDALRRYVHRRPEPELAQLPHVLRRRPRAHRAAAVQHPQHAARDPAERLPDADSQRVVLRPGDVRPLQSAVPHRRARATTARRRSAVRTARRWFPKASAAWTFTNCVQAALPHLRQAAPLVR